MYKTKATCQHFIKTSSYQFFISHMICVLDDNLLLNNYKIAMKSSVWCSAHRTHQSLCHIKGTKIKRKKCCSAIPVKLKSFGLYSVDFGFRLD